jgi:hypothetical protein
MNSSPGPSRADDRQAAENQTRSPLAPPPGPRVTISERIAYRLGAYMVDKRQDLLEQLLVSANWDDFLDKRGKIRALDDLVGEHNELVKKGMT